jgi:outer membrane protein W
MERKNSLLEYLPHVVGWCAIKRTALAFAMFASAGIVFAPSIAQAEEDKGDYDWKLFLGGSYVAPLSKTDVTSLGTSVKASSELGYEIGVEWKGTDRFGFEIAYLDANSDIKAVTGKVGDITMRPWDFTLNFHIIDANIFNWYIGPTLSYISWSDLKLNNGFKLPVDSQTTYGVSTGLVIGLGQTFGIQFGLRYIEASIDAGLPQKIKVDPLFASVAVSFRF